MRPSLVYLWSLALEAGDVGLTAAGAFVVLEKRLDELDLLWLETGRRVVTWTSDPVYGPVEVLRAR